MRFIRLIYICFLLIVGNSCSGRLDKFKVFNKEILIHSKGIFFYKNHFYVSYLNEIDRHAFVFEFDEKGRLKSSVSLHSRSHAVYIYDVNDEYLLLDRLIGRGIIDPPKIYYDTLSHNTYPEHFLFIGNKEVVVRMDARAFSKHIGMTYVIDSFKLDKSNNEIWLFLADHKVFKFETYKMEVYNNRITVPKLVEDRISYDEYFYSAHFSLQDLVAEILDSNKD